MDDQKERIKFMKKYFALLLTIMMAFTACSGSPAVDSSGLESLSKALRLLLKARRRVLQILPQSPKRISPSSLPGRSICLKTIKWIQRFSPSCMQIWRVPMSMPWSQ